MRSRTDPQSFEADDIGVAVVDGTEKFVIGFGVELDVATRGAFGDDARDFFDFDVGASDLMPDGGEYADAVVGVALTPPICTL